MPGCCYHAQCQFLAAFVEWLERLVLQPVLVGFKPLLMEVSCKRSARRKLVALKPDKLPEATPACRTRSQSGTLRV